MNFIEEREYVDFVTNLDVYSVKNNIKTPFDDIIKGGDESAVLTSVVASEHQVSTTAVC